MDKPCLKVGATPFYVSIAPLQRYARSRPARPTRPAISQQSGALAGHVDRGGVPKANRPVVSKTRRRDETPRLGTAIVSDARPRRPEQRREKTRRRRRRRRARNAGASGGPRSTASPSYPAESVGCKSTDVVADARADWAVHGGQSRSVRSGRVFQHGKRRVQSVGQLLDTDPNSLTRFRE